MALARTLAPTTLEAFFSSYVERQPLHIARNQPGYFDDAYAIGDVEDSLIVGAREPEYFCLVRTGQPELPVEEFTYERPGVRARLTGKASARWLDARRIVAYYAEGYTLIIKDAALFCARLQRFSNRLQRDLAAYVQPNVYLTPPQAQGFDVHHDTHDTLTAQIQGRKTWRIYEPLVELPLESQPFAFKERPQDLKLVAQVDLNPGDTLYIPRGFPHEARTSDDLSLHCTFALAPIRIYDVLEILVRIAGDTDVSLRESLTPRLLGERALSERLGALYRDRLEPALATDRVAIAVEIALDELFRISRPNTSNAFAQTLLTREIDTDTPIRLDDTVPFHIRGRNGIVEIAAAGKVVVLPGTCAPALAALQAGPTTAGAMDPGLSPADRYALVKRLVVEGLVIIG